MSTEHDDHYWDVAAQRQLLKVIGWLGDFISPEFRARVWQNGTKPWEYYEETMSEFFEDFNIVGLLVDGLKRLGIGASVITSLAKFTDHFDAFDETIPRPVDAEKLEADPTFQRLVAEAREILGNLLKAQKSMRTVVDDL